MSRFIFAASIIISSYIAPQIGAAAIQNQPQQICLSTDGIKTSCFLEIIASGRSALYATLEAQAYLNLNEAVVSANAEFITLDEASYAASLDELKPATYLFSPNRLDQFDYESIQNCAQNEEKKGEGAWKDWGKCVAGTVGGAGLGALGGAATGSAVPGVGTVGGAIAGAVFGGLSGAATSCGYGFHIHYKGVAYDVTENRYIPGRKCF